MFHGIPKKPVVKKRKREDDPETRVNRDKRTSRKEHSSVFQKAVGWYRKRWSPNTDVRGGPRKWWNGGSEETFEVFVRKRPIFQKEIKRQEYDIVTAFPKEKSALKLNTIVVHDCRMRADLKVKNSFVDNFEFTGLNGVFSEVSTNKQVYMQTGMVLLQHILAGKQHKSSIFMFGATGSGKTFTMTAIMKELVKDLFLWKQYMKNISVYVSIFEMDGSQCSDLLRDRRELKLRVNETNELQLVGLKKLKCHNDNELNDAIEKGMSARKTHSTRINSVSSRSHCFVRISLMEKHGKSETPFSSIQLLDLAGSERNADSQNHNKQRRKECAFINSSLMCLKECLRVFHRNRSGKGRKDRMPYRNNVLTRLLKDTFTSTSDVSRNMIIGTCSPCQTDTEHTVNTLNHIAMMCKNAKCKRTILDVKTVVDFSVKRIIHPRKWKNSDVKTFIRSVQQGKYAKYVDAFPSQIDGKQLCRYSEKRFAQIVQSNVVGEIFREALLMRIRRSSNQKKMNAKKMRKISKGKYAW